MFEFTIHLEEDDYIQFNLYHYFNSPSNKKTILLTNLLMPLISILFIASLIMNKSDLLLIIINVILLSFASLFWFLIRKKIVLYTITRRIQGMKKDGKLPFNSTSTIKFEEELIYETNPRSESKILYSSIEKVIETNTAIYLYISSVQSLLLPKNVFLDEIQKANFLAFINEKRNASN